MESILELRSLSKHYSTHRAVEDVSLSIRKGEFFSLVGPSGCGKTTTLRLIAGFEHPTSGEILLDGQPLAGLAPHQRDVCTVFQNYALFPHLTVEQNLAFGLERRRNIPKQRIREEVGDALALVRLSGKESRFPNQISGGERQRVALARSLVIRPKVLLLDEPLSALDAKLRKEMRQELKKLQRSVGIAFLFITHDQEEALSLSDRVAVMNKGKLEQIGAPQELYRCPQSRFVAEFLGEVNRLNGVCVRPEAVHVSRGLPAPAAHSTIGIVESTTFLGNCLHLEARLPDGSHCVAELPQHRCDFAAGETVNLWWHAADEFRIPGSD
ncbi:MAG TPA: ABC transporter ATP-binding protein [Bryobacteraceae bacterium]